MKFLDKIPAMTGGRDAILKRARELWAPGDAPAKKRAKMAVETVLAAIRDNLRAPLVALIDRHVQAIEDGYVLEEGEAPAYGDISPAALDWWTGLYEAQEAAAGDAAKMLGTEAFRKWVRSDEPAETLADALIAKPIEDVARTLSVCGVTQEDIEALSQSGAASVQVRAAQVRDAQVRAVAEEATGANAGGNHVTPAEEAPAVAATTAEAPARAPRKRSASVEASAVTAAARDLLVVLADYAKDAEVAGALEVSRAQVINYRQGKTLFAPSPKQMDAIEALVATMTSRLAGAIGALKMAELE